MRQHIFIFCIVLWPFHLLSQARGDSSGQYNTISAKTLDRLASSYNSLNVSINKSSLDLLARMQKKEAALKGKIKNTDSSKVRQLFVNGTTVYRQLETKLKDPVANPLNTFRNYIPGLDSLTTAIQFLSKSGLPVQKLQQLQSLDKQLKELQGSFQNANDIQNYITQREAQLKDQLRQFGLSKQLLGVNKEVYYYQQNLSQYKAVVNDQQKQEQLIMSVIRNVPAFQNFWKKNSLLAQLFPESGNSGTLLAAAGLQTNKDVSKMIQQRMGTSVEDEGVGATWFLKQQIQGAQGKMDLLKDKLNSLHLPGGGSNMTMPDFTPNGQKQKSLLKRLEYGFNIQNNSTTFLLPAISSLGLSLGYKLNDKATIGIGINYLLGLGNNIKHIKLSNQGIGVRSFLNVKIKGSISVTGGYEYNYMQQFAGVNSINNLELWQKSGLIGLTKNYSVGKKSGNIQILYDLLANYELPRGQAFKIRYGFGF